MSPPILLRTEHPAGELRTGLNPEIATLSLSLTKQILSPSPHSYIKIMLSARISAARRVPAFARLARFYSEGDVARSKEFSCVFFSLFSCFFVRE